MKRLFVVAVLSLLPLQTNAGTVWNQPPTPSGTILQSSQQGGTDYDQYVWDRFVVSPAQTITEVDWRGGYDPAKFNSGGPVLDFTVAIYASIPGGTQPDVVSPPLATYSAGGNAGQTPAGTFGGTAMYDYRFTLPTPFDAAAGTKYWVQIEALQSGIPDWGLATATNGNCDGGYFRCITAAGDKHYQAVPGNAAFSLQAPDAPEPPSLVLLGLGALGLIVWRTGRWFIGAQRRLLPATLRSMTQRTATPS